MACKSGSCFQPFTGTTSFISLNSICERPSSPSFRRPPIRPPPSRPFASIRATGAAILAITPDQIRKRNTPCCSPRSFDEYIELFDRPDIAKRRGADLFVSLHFNAFPQSNVRGAEVYCLTPAGAASTNARGEGGGSGSFPGNRFNPRNMLLAYDVQKSLVRSLSVEDRGVHRARFAVLRGAAMPAVLIEGGFMSHPSEGRKIFDPAYRREMARAISDGILNYKHQTEGAGAVGTKPTR